MASPWDIGLGVATGGLYNVGKKAWDHFQVSGPGGTGGAVDQSRLHPNPDGTYTAEGLVQNPDGTYFDPVTGTSYTDQSGQTPIAAPNVAQQISSASQNSRDQLARMQEADARAKEAYGGQQRLAGNLENTVRNPNAPSVARAQLDATIGNIDRQQLSGIAGVGAPNAAAARKQALMNMANLDLGAAGQGAIVRANEVASAQNQLGNVYQNMAGNAGATAGQGLSGALGFGQQAMGGAQGNQAAASAAQSANQAMAAGLLTGGLVTGSKFIPGGSNSNEAGTDPGTPSTGKVAGAAAFA